MQIESYFFFPTKNINKQVSALYTYTNKKVHDIISKNIKLSAMYSGRSKVLDQDIVQLKIRLLNSMKRKGISKMFLSQKV